MAPITPFDNWRHQCYAKYGYLIPDCDIFPEAFGWYCEGKTPEQYAAFASQRD